MKESPYLDENGFLLKKLQQLPFLGSVGEKYIKNILRVSRLRKFENGELITREGQHDTWVYLLFSGAVRIVKNGRELNRLDEVGATFGEIAALDGKPRSASAEAMGETVCLAIDTSFMNESEEPLEQALFVTMLYKLFSEVLAGRLRKKDDQLEKVQQEFEELKVERNRLRDADQNYRQVRSELDALKKEVGKRWMIK